MTVHLADREAGLQPHRYDFATLEEYLAAWYHWRAVRRDAGLTDDEINAKLEACAWKLGIPFDDRWRL